MENIGQEKLRKKYAAMCYSQGCLRVLLHSILMDGSADPLEIRTLYEATAATNVAKAIGLEDEDMFPDWDKWLTDSEKYALRGWNFGSEEDG